MSFLYPENAIFGILALILLFITKKVRFTHLEFFKQKRFFAFSILDILILISLTLLLMYPVTKKTINTSVVKNYSFVKNNNKKHIIIIFDVSTSMDDNNYFEKAKDDAKWKVLENKGNYIMLVVFEKDYKILSNFTTNYHKVLDKINFLKFNMVTDIGGSMLRDTVAGIINGFRDLNPKIIIYSDGSLNDESSVSKEELKKLAKDVSIEYIGYGNNENNVYYSSIFSVKKEKDNTFNKNITISKKIEYKVFDVRFVYIALILMFVKILKARFENYFNFI